LLKKKEKLKQEAGKTDRDSGYASRYGIDFSARHSPAPA
jgi:hypothetical protein